MSLTKTITATAASTLPAYGKPKCVRLAALNLTVGMPGTDPATREVLRA